MADELEPCPFCGNDTVHVHDNYVGGSGFMVMCGSCTAEGPLCNTEGAAASEWNRRAAPIAAQLDQDNLPPLPAALSRDDTEHDTDYFTAEQYRQGQRDAIAADRAHRAAQLDAELPPLLDKVAADIELYAESYDMMERMNGGGNKVSCTCVAVDLRQNIIPQVQKRFAPYAERIRLLERELEAARQVGKHLFTAVAESSAKQPAQSIDTPEFVKLEAAYVKALYEYPDAPSMKRADALTAARRALIAYIDGRIACTASDAWISVADHLPEAGELVLVYSPPTKYDHLGEVNITFDCIDPDADDPSWLNHNEHYEHFCCVAKPEGSVGPSEHAPYTHWKRVAAPSPQENTK